MFRFIFRDLRGSVRALWVFCACLLLGVMLIAASAGLLRQVSGGLLADSRALLGGDLEIQQRFPISNKQLSWIRQHAEVSLLIEMRTMLRTADGRSQVVELQSIDASYPLYGTVELTPQQALHTALGRDGDWGIVIDPVLARRLDLQIGDEVILGELRARINAVSERQPDRSLRASWRGTPVLLSAEALAATGLLRPGSLLKYQYRIKTEQPALDWRAALTAAFPAADWEVRTFTERSRRIGEVLAQVGSVLLLIGLSALFIGGLGVANSIHAYLQSKLTTLATLRALGLREQRLIAVYLGQIVFLAGFSSLIGALAGGALALVGTALTAERLPLTATIGQLAGPLLMAFMFGILTAVTFALPALGRALSVNPAALFRGIDGARTFTPRHFWWLTAAGALLTAALVFSVLPQPLFGLGFLLLTGLLLVLLECIVRLLRRFALLLSGRPLLAGRFQLRLALANLYRPGTPLRATLLTLGSALTLLVATTLVVVTLLRTLHDTVPARAPALVFYDIANFQLQPFRAALQQTPDLQRLDLAPLVLGRLSRVNDELLRESADSRRALEARDEHKLSYRLNNFDQVMIDRGAWWPENYQGPPLVAMEDREADQLGLKIGDRLEFSILGEKVTADLVAIYSQRRFEARFWLEAIFSAGVLDPFISRYVGTAYLDHDKAIDVQTQLAAAFPNVVTIRTEGVLREARLLLARAAAGLGVVALLSLIASFLVLISVVASTRMRQVYDATILHALGARLSQVRQALRLEYALIALLTTLFAVLLGSLIAYTLLEYRLGLQAGNIAWLGLLTAALVSSLSLSFGAYYLLRHLRLSPALLLRAGG